MQRTSFCFKDCRRTIQLRVAIAIYFLGKLGDVKSIPLFKEILCDPQEYEKDLYHEVTECSYKFNGNKNFNEIYFQVVSQASVAVTKIIKKHPEVYEIGAKILQKAFEDNRHIKNTTSLPNKTFEYESMENIKTYVLSRI